jgi:hypothetical protein
MMNDLKVARRTCSPTVRVVYANGRTRTSHPRSRYYIDSLEAPKPDTYYTQPYLDAYKAQEADPNRWENIEEVRGNPASR